MKFTATVFIASVATVASFSPAAVTSVRSATALEGHPLGGYQPSNEGTSGSADFTKVPTRKPPIFSGFGHVTDPIIGKPTRGNSLMDAVYGAPSPAPAASSTPVFSVFGHKTSTPETASGPVFSEFAYSTSGHMGGMHAPSLLGAVDTPPPQAPAPAPVKRAAPIFSGFGHATRDAPASARAPIFSGFGHAAANAFKPADSSEARKPIFSGFANAMRTSNSEFGHSNVAVGGNSAPSLLSGPPPVYSSYGHA